MGEPLTQAGCSRPICMGAACAIRSFSPASGPTSPEPHRRCWSESPRDLTIGPTPSRAPPRRLLADCVRREDAHRRARNREGGMGSDSHAESVHEGGGRAYEQQSQRIAERDGRRSRPSAGTARWSSSGISGLLPRRWRGAFSWISCITGGKSPPTCDSDGLDRPAGVWSQRRRALKAGRHQSEALRAT